MMRNLSIVLLAAVPAHAAASETAREFFDALVERNQRFDATAASLYLPDARISTLRDGSDRQEMTGSQLQAIAERAYAAARARRESDRFDDIAIEERGESATVRAVRFATIKCYVDRDYRLELVRLDGAWRIEAEHSSTISLSACAPSPKLAEALRRTHEALAPRLPMMLDEETRLDAVEVRGVNLIYSQSFTEAGIKELDRERLVPALRQGAVQEICSDRGLRAMMVAGATIRYAYAYHDEEPIVNVDVSNGLCP